MSLADLGWSPFFSQQMEPDELLVVGRVSSQHRNLYRVLTETGELVCNLSGHLRNFALHAAELPAVGDWVLLRPREFARGTIHSVLLRRTKISRRAAGNRNDEQIIGANVDTLFIVTALDGDFSLRRMERYLSLAAEGGVDPVLILNKCDLAVDLEGKRTAVAAIAQTAPVHVVSAHTGEGMQQLTAYLSRGQTVAFVGSSGVGKSTLINSLFGSSVQPTRPVRSTDGRGQHTTTTRKLIPLPGGAVLLDTPGMRELQLWAEDDVLDASFGDIVEAARDCRFRDCTHRNEPCCAVRDSIDPGRLASFHKQQKELAYLHRQQNVSAAQAERQKWKAIHKSLRNFQKGQ